MNKLIELHIDLVTDLTKPGEDVIDDLDPIKAHLWHMVTGVSGEAGELLDAVKKHVVYNKPLDTENVLEELGDLLFYMRGLQLSLDITDDQIIQANIDKLRKRYPKGYTNKAAQIRADKTNET